MSNELIERLSKLRIEQKYLKRALDTYYLDKDKKRKYHEKIDNNNKEMEYIKFKLTLEKEMRKNDENISDRFRQY